MSSKSHKGVTWDVINQLIIAFDNPTNNFLFRDISGLSDMTAEHTSEDWAKLFNCYSIGEERLNAILKQDVLKSEEQVATGRRAKNIGHHTIANMKKSHKNNRGHNRGRIQNRERGQHESPSNIITNQSSNSNTFIFQPISINDSQHSFNTLPNPNNSFDQNINALNNTLHNIQLNSQEQNVPSQSNPNAEIQSFSDNTQITHSPSNLIENPCLTKRIKRTTHAQELQFLEPLVNNTSEENINNAIQQLNNWNITNNHPENVWNKQRVIKWIQTRTRKDRLAREK